MSTPKLTLGEPDAKKTPLSDNFQHINRIIVDAYARCRRVEKIILAELESPSHADATRAPLDAQLVYIRLLGHLMDKGPGDAATSQIARSVVSAMDDEELFQVGKWYLEHFICAFRKARVQTPASSTPTSSREQSPISGSPSPQFDTIQDMIDAQLIPYPMNRRDAEQSALARDNFRCLVSGAPNHHALVRNKELMQETLDRFLRVDITYCCHIIKEDFSPKVFLSPPSVQRCSYLVLAARVRCPYAAILESFGYTQISEDLAGSKIHSLKNVLTMDSYNHSLFNRMDLWFEATDEPNRYKVCTTMPAIFPMNNTPRFVKFESTSPELELPSPEYLGLHAVCCRVAHMSGATRYLVTLDDLAASEDY
ncbi:hypothetical protein BD779DRAFT_1679049 [Infundibulicybe gibba]|nr:hypothetical protein BD779DRAFT_1679049 [Infundibulicybe gibba]